MIDKIREDLSDPPLLSPVHCTIGSRTMRESDLRGAQWSDEQIAEMEAYNSEKNMQPLKKWRMRNDG